MNHGSALFLESWSIVRACMLRLLGTSSQQANLKLIIICRTTGQQPAPLIKITHHLPLLVIQLSTLLLFSYIFCLINSFIHSFIHTEHLYSASSRGLLRGATITKELI